MKRFSILAIIVGLAVGASMGCSGSDTPTEPTDPVDVTPVDTVTETFEGSISQLDTSCHHFETSERADVTLNLTEIGPLPTLTVGMGIGTSDEIVEGSDEDQGCTLFASDRSVQAPATLLSASLGAGQYCVCVFDVGNIFANRVIDYTVEVEHSVPPVV